MESVVTGKILKRFLKISVFILVFIYIFVHMTYVFREPLSHTREHLCGFYSEKKNTVDVAVIGTSCTFSAIAPMQLWEDHGIAAYDFCTNVMLTNTMRYAIDEIYKTQSPSLLIIDIAPFMNGYIAPDPADYKEQDTQILRYNTDGFKISANRIKLINEVVKNPIKRFNYYFDLFYYHSNPSPEFKNWNWNMPSAYKGYSNLQTDVVFPDTPSVFDEAESYPLSSDEQAVLDTLLDKIDAEGLNVLFMAGPYWPVDDRVETRGKARYLQEYLEESGYDFLNLHDHLEEIGMDGTRDYSMDFNHYSITGAIKTSKFLGQYLTDRYNLPDRRLDAGYDKWRAEYKEWTDTILPDNISWSERMLKEYLDSH